MPQLIQLNDLGLSRLTYAVGIGAGAEDPVGSELEFTTNNPKELNNEYFQLKEL